MRRLLILFLIIFNITPVFADVIRTSPYFSKFPSKLRNTNYSNNYYYNPRKGYRDNLHRQKVLNKYCPQCNHHNYHKPIRINNLNRLEKYALDRTYNSEDEFTRLERLEDLAFGAIQAGDYTTRYKNLESAILSRPKFKTKNSVFGTIGNFLSGCATGVTPNIISQDLDGYNNFTQFTPFGGNSFGNTIRPYPNYNNNIVEQYSNGIFGGGWGIYNNDFGNGSRIRILP